MEGTSTTIGYDYDLAGRLIEVNDGGVITTYGYDDNGNRTHVNGALVANYDDQDRLLQYGDNTYSYTANGELETKTDTTSTDVTGFDYDVLGNLMAVTSPTWTNSSPGNPLRKSPALRPGLNATPRRVSERAQRVATGTSRSQRPQAVA